MAILFDVTSIGSTFCYEPPFAGERVLALRLDHDLRTDGIPCEAIAERVAISLRERELNVVAITGNFVESCDALTTIVTEIVAACKTELSPKQFADCFVLLTLPPEEFSALDWEDLEPAANDLVVQLDLTRASTEDYMSCLDVFMNRDLSQAEFDVRVRLGVTRGNTEMVRSAADDVLAFIPSTHLYFVPVTERYDDRAVNFQSTSKNLKMAEELANSFRAQVCLQSRGLLY